MMKKLVLLLGITLIACSSKERNCKDFKTGTFEFTQVVNGKKLSSTFVRTDSIQIETFNGKTDTATVRWVNDCEFILRKLHPKNMEEQKAISMIIITTKDNSYTFDYSYVGESKKQRGTVTKIK